MENKRFLKQFANQADYEAQKDSVMGFPHVVLLEDTKGLVYQPDIPAIDYSKEYFTIESLEDGTVGVSVPSSADSMKYRVNGGEWVETSEAFQLSVLANDKIQISCVCSDLELGCSSFFNISAPFKVYGNIMSLLHGDDFEGKTDLTGYGSAFAYLFYGCPTLTDASNLILPAIILSNSCYRNMFLGCTSLTVAPKLPAITLVSGCYRDMFYGCTSLTVAPELPATTLAGYCYSSMFMFCKNLTVAPKLPATTLAERCYYAMFQSCSNLNHITMLATDISASYCLDNWVNGVASNGVFVKSPFMNSLPSGASGIPTGWSVEDYIS